LSKVVATSCTSASARYGPICRLITRAAIRSATGQSPGAHRWA
jgi:hypothetical protein